MCLCGMLAAEYRTLPEPLQASVSAFFDTNTSWLRGVLEQGGAEGSLRLLGSPDDVAAMVLGGLEGAMLITRLDGDVARFRAATDRLLNGLVPA
jgi:TetR/AcrR family transcriptional repressor of nem operon